MNELREPLGRRTHRDSGQSSSRARGPSVRVRKAVPDRLGGVVASCDLPDGISVRLCVLDAGIIETVLDTPRSDDLSITEDVIISRENAALLRNRCLVLDRGPDGPAVVYR